VDKKIKTLKQLLQEKEFNSGYFKPNTKILLTKNVIDITHYWLMQKRRPELKMNFPGNGTESVNRFIDELLEELKETEK
jgi:hypothetical protein